MSNIEIGKISLDDIIPAEYNPRRMSNTEYKKLSESIHNFGLVDPIIINLRNNKIIGGHQRYRILYDECISNPTKPIDLHIIKLGDIGWAFPDTDLHIESEEHEKALNILLNQKNLMGDWDNIKLEELLNDLNSVNFDLEMTGFDDYELELYLDGDYDSFQFDDYGSDDYSDELPDDYVDVTGDNARKSYVVSIGFDNHNIANMFLDYIEYPRHMKRDTLQFMFSELDWDLDKLLRDKYGDEYFTDNLGY